MFCLDFFLCRRITFAVLKLSGMRPVELIVLNRAWSGSIRFSQASEYTDILSPSGPAADFLFDFLMAFLISDAYVYMMSRVSKGFVKNPFLSLISSVLLCFGAS